MGKLEEIIAKVFELDISKIKKDLNWKPQITIEEGIKDLLSKIQYWKNAPVWTPKSIKKATKIWFKLLSK